MLTPGNVADVKAHAREVLAEKGYDADALRRSLLQTGTMPVIPERFNRKRHSLKTRALQQQAPDRERLLPPQGPP